MATETSSGRSIRWTFLFVSKQEQTPSDRFLFLNRLYWSFTVIPAGLTCTNIFLSVNMKKQNSEGSHAALNNRGNIPQINNRNLKLLCLWFVHELHDKDSVYCSVNTLPQNRNSNVANFTSIKIHTHWTFPHANMMRFDVTDRHKVAQNQKCCETEQK